MVAMKEDIGGFTEVDNYGLVLKVKLEPRHFKAEKKLISDGFFYKILNVSSSSRVNRIKHVDGYHLKLKSLSTPVTRWVALKNDPDYIVHETGV